MKIKKEKIDKLKEKGVTQIASIVKSHFSTWREKCIFTKF